MINYIRVAYDELTNKVTWPTTAELQSSALVVMVASLIIALVVFAMDRTFQMVTDVIYSISL